MKKINSLLFIALMSLIFGCAPARFVEPLNKNEWSIGGNFGGPLLDLNAPIPIPLSAVEIGYGLDSNLTVFGAVHTTAALFGNVQMDGGVTYQFIEQDKYLPNISTSPSFNFIYNFENGTGKVWPIIDLNAWWNYGKRKNYFYVGVNNYFELSAMNADEQPIRQHWIFNPQFGHLLKDKRERWQFTAEIKWLSPVNDNSYAFVPYNTLGTRGALGFYVGFRWILGKKK